MGYFTFHSTIITSSSILLLLTSSELHTMNALLQINMHSLVVKILILSECLDSKLKPIQLKRFQSPFTNFTQDLLTEKWTSHITTLRSK